MATIWCWPGMAAIVMVTVEEASGQCQAMLDYDNTHRDSHTTINPEFLPFFEQSLVTHTTSSHVQKQSAVKK